MRPASLGDMGTRKPRRKGMATLYAICDAFSLTAGLAHRLFDQDSGFHIQASSFEPQLLNGLSPSSIEPF